eukprot:673022-Pleurochrysis_carterae.AAC.1
MIATHSSLRFNLYAHAYPPLWIAMVVKLIPPSTTTTASSDSPFPTTTTTTTTDYGSGRGSNATIAFAAQKGRQHKDKSNLYDGNNYMAVNAIDAVFPPNSNLCNNARIVQTVIVLARGCEAV